MTDVHSPAQRANNMAAIRSSGTKPEMAVRRALHARGYRFRLQGNLTGHPDMVLARFRTVIFVHGCFWHLHHCKYGQAKPSTRAQFWRTKREANAHRDTRVTAHLRTLGWHVLVVWECETRVPATLNKAITRIERRLALSTPEEKIQHPRRDHPRRTSRHNPHPRAGSSRTPHG